jgi:hypothetical protein
MRWEGRICWDFARFTGGEGAACCAAPSVNFRFCGFNYAETLTPVVADDDVELGVELVEVKLGKNCCRSDCSEE